MMMKVTEKQIKKYEELVSQNNHGEVYEEIANDLDENRYMTLFKNINQIQAIEGYLHPDLHAVRNRIREDFKAYLLQTLTDVDYENIAKYI